ncbi:hypothetical protein D3C81_09740 [compost metagenome]
MIKLNGISYGSIGGYTLVPKDKNGFLILEQGKAIIEFTLDTNGEFNFSSYEGSDLLKEARKIHKRLTELSKLGSQDGSRVKSFLITELTAVRGLFSILYYYNRIVYYAIKKYESNRQDYIAVAMYNSNWFTRGTSSGNICIETDSFRYGFRTIDEVEEYAIKCFKSKQAKYGVNSLQGLVLFYGEFTWDISWEDFHSIYDIK